MQNPTFAALIAAGLALAFAAHAQTPTQTLSVADAYARSANPKSGAVFMTIANAGTEACTLVGATGTVAERIELHTNIDDGGVMKMVKLEDGIAIPAGGSHALARGGDHVMLMGLNAPLKDGEKVALTLDFGPCGTLPVEAVVDNARKPEAMDHGAPADHGGMAHGAPAAAPTATPAN